MRAALRALLICFTFATQAAEIDHRGLEALLDEVMAREMAARKIPGAAFILVQGGRVVLAKGYGFADVESKTPFDPETTIAPIASITKVFTATAVVQLADRGALDLHADVNRYLKRVRVPDAFGQPVTAAQLLTHTAGFDELRGRLVAAGEPVQPMDRFLATRLVRIRAPGRLTSYSSFGMALAGLLVEDVSGMPFERYLACNVWAPLGMKRTYITLPAELLPDAAGAYEAGESGGLVKIPWERYHTPPASSINSTAADMGRFMISMLAGGKGILGARAAGEMMSQRATLHPRMPGMSYGWQMSATNGQRIVEHGGDIGGFSSLLTLLPDHDTGIYLVNHREGIDLREPVRSAILDRYFPDPSPPAIPQPSAALVPQAKKVAGKYRATTWCHTCPFDPDRVQDFEVVAHDDGSITVWDRRWIAVEPLLFAGADGRGRIGFHLEEKGEVDAMTAGSWRVLERLRTMPP